MESKNKTSVSQSLACAACKYQRRKCKPDCPLAPFFPSSSHLDFLAVHKLFGVNNILKSILRFNSLPAKEAAVKTMIFQAKARAADPVGGCHRMICHLKNQIQYYENELQIVRQQLQFHKLAASQFMHKPVPPPVPPDNSPIDNVDGSLPIYHSSLDFLPDFPEACFYKGNCDSRQVFDGISVKVEKVEKVSQSSGLGGGCDTESSAIISQSDEQSVTVDLSEDIKPLLGVFDDKFNTLFLDSKSSDHGKVLLEDDESIQVEEVEENQHKDT